MWASAAAEVHSVGPWHLQYSPQCPGTQKASGRGVHLWPWGLRAVPLSSWAGWALVTCLSALSLSFPCGMSRCPPSLGSQKGHPGWLLLSLLSTALPLAPPHPGRAFARHAVSLRDSGAQAEAARWEGQRQGLESTVLPECTLGTLILCVVSPSSTLHSPCPCPCSDLGLDSKALRQDWWVAPARAPDPCYHQQGAGPPWGEIPTPGGF